YSGERFWGGVITGAIIAPLFYPPRVYTPPYCSNRVVSPGYYAYDSWGRHIWVLPMVVRECY
ncbi:hypothetical protein KJ761_00215, partial [Patescibacteria group bacterium]|nr:hypothetical protein [Patescibacteria group bacterium]